MSLNTVTVTWSEDDPTLAGLNAGTVTFTLSSVLTDTADSLVIHPIPQSYAFSAGTTKPLVANDNGAALPSGSYYTITIQPYGQSPYTFQAFLNRANGASQALASLVSITTPPTMLAYLPLPSGTPLAGEVPVATGVAQGSAWGFGSGLIPSGDTTGAIDTARIQGLLNLGGIVTLQAGSFYTNAPLTIPPGAGLVGVAGNVFSLSAGYGTVIKASSSWAQGTAPAAAMILLLNQTDGGYAGLSEEQKILRLSLDGTALPVTADGIQGLGNVQNVLIRDVFIGFYDAGGVQSSNISGNGLSQVTAHGAIPDTWRVENVLVRRAGLSGFVCLSPDSMWVNCEAIGCAQQGTSVPGWSIATCSNSQFVGCRSENTGNLGNGFTYTGSNAGGGGVVFSACSTDGNGGHGFQITSQVNAGSGPVALNGCRFTDDGLNPMAWLGNAGGNGGGGFAGLFITNASSVITITGCHIVNGTAGSGTAPQYGLLVTSDNTIHHSRITVANSLLWGATAAVSNDGTCPALILDANCVLATGTGPSPVYTVPATKLVAASSAAPVPTGTEELLGARTGATGQTLPRWALTASNLATVSGTVSVRAIILPAGIPVNNITFQVGGTAKTGGTHGWYVLLDTTRKVLAVSADQTDPSTTWGSINTEQALAVLGAAGATYVTTYSGIYYVGVMVANSAGTQPNFMAGPNFVANQAGASPPLGGTSSAGQTTAPAVGTILAAFAGAAGSNFFAYTS